MAIANAVAKVKFGDLEFTLADTLKRVRHIRGFSHCTSFCIIEIEHTSTELVFDYMNYDEFDIKYGVAGQDLSDWFTMKVFKPINMIEFNKTYSRILGVEPGFVDLCSQHRIRSFSNKRVSDIVEQVANENNLGTDNIRTTRGLSTFVQPNVTDLQFINNFLLPIAIDPGDTVPYLFTIDDGDLFFKPPDLRSEVEFDYSVYTHAENNVKKFVIENLGAFSDFMTGRADKTYGYNFVDRGLLTSSQDFDSVSGVLLNNEIYESDFYRERIVPYQDNWMVDAYNKNLIGKSSFVIGCKAELDGSIYFYPGQINNFDIPKLAGDLAEYSGKYYTYDVVQDIRSHAFTTYIKLVNNSMQEGIGGF